MKYWIRFLFLIYLVNIQARWSSDPAKNNPIYTVNNNQKWPQFVCKENYGAILTWQDYRNGNWDIYASRVDSSGNLGDPTSIRSEDVTKIPNAFKLGQNFPNPFNPSTVISYKLPVTSNVSLKIYDILGNEIVTLVDENKPAGSYEVDFNPALSIKHLASGVYYCRLQTENFSKTIKMLYLK